MIVVTEFMAAEGLTVLAGGPDLVYEPDLHSDRTRLLRKLSNAVALIVRNRTVVDEELLAAAPRLRTVGRLGVGLDNIDVAALERRGVALHTAAGLNAATVAEYVIAAAFVLTRRAFGATGEILDGHWPRTDLVGGEIAGRRLGIIGFGSAGQAVAARAAALGMRCVAADPFLQPDDAAWGPTKPVDLAAALASDVVTLHVPLTQATHQLVNEATLAEMPQGAILINTARGEVLDLAAVAGALRTGALGGAALDVLPEEPPSAETRRLLADVPNLLLTPHIAGITQESNARIGSHIAHAVLEEVA